MLDKQVHIDEKFTGRAWREMSRMLDLEMPAQTGKQRRRLGFWWFAVFGLLLLMAGAGLVFFGKKAPATAAVPTQPVAGAMFTPPIGAEAPKPTTPDAAKRLPGEAEPSVLPSKPASDFVVENALSPKNAKPEPALATQEKAIANQPILTKTNPPSNDFASQKLAATLPVAPTLEAISTADHEPFSFVKTTTPAPLETTGLRQFDRPENPAPTIATTLKNPFRSGWGLALQGGGMAAVTSPANGLSLEMIAAKSLKNSKLSVEIGLGYSFIQQPLSVVVNEATANDSLRAIVYGTANGADLALEENSGIQTRYSEGLKLHYATFPVQFSYRIGSRFSVKVGLQPGLLLSSQSDFVNGGLLWSKSSASFDSSSASSSNFEVSTIDLAATGGIGFQVSPLVSLQAGYKFGVLDVLPGNHSGDFNRLVHASVRYNLKGKN